MTSLIHLPMNHSESDSGKVLIPLHHCAHGWWSVPRERGALSGFGQSCLYSVISQGEKDSQEEKMTLAVTVLVFNSRGWPGAARQHLH